MRVWNQPGYVFHQCDMRYGFVHNGALSFGCGVPINPQMADHFYDLKLSMAWRPGEFHPSPPFMQDSVSNTFGGLKTWRHNQQTLHTWLMTMIRYTWNNPSHIICTHGPNMVYGLSSSSSSGIQTDWDILAIPILMKPPGTLPIFEEQKSRCWELLKGCLFLLCWSQLISYHFHSISIAFPYHIPMWCWKITHHDEIPPVIFLVSSFSVIFMVAHSMSSPERFDHHDCEPVTRRTGRWRSGKSASEK